MTFVDEPWPFALARRAEIEAHWRGRVAANPALFNGRVLKARGCRIEGDVFRAEAFESDFASFLFWRDDGFRDESVKNLFGSAVVHSIDGGLVLGRMAQWTGNPGLIYPFGGSLEPSDVKDGKVDVEGSILRELKEEAGIDAAEAEAAPGVLAIFDGPRVSLAKIFTLQVSSATLAARIEAFLASETRPELDGVHIVRSRADLLPDRMPPYTQAYIRHAYGGPD